MDDDEIRTRLEVLEEFVREMFRREVITDDMVEAVVERFEIRAANHAGSDREQRYADAAHQAQSLPFEAGAEIMRASDRNAEFRRRQMRERTAMINPADGGNDRT